MLASYPRQDNQLGYHLPPSNLQSDTAAHIPPRFLGDISTTPILHYQPLITPKGDVSSGLFLPAQLNCGIGIAPAIGNSMSRSLASTNFSQATDVKLTAAPAPPHTAIQYTASCDPMPLTAGLPHNDWQSLAGLDNFVPQETHLHHMKQPNGKSHNRALSGSSVGSTGPASPLDQAIYHPHIVQQGSPSLSPARIEAGMDLTSVEPNHSTIFNPVKRPLTPSHNPSRESFLAPAFQNYNPSSPNSHSNLAAQMAMKQALMEEQNGVVDDETPGFAYSGRHSVSSVGQDSPATPRTNYGEGGEESTRTNHSDFRTMPKLGRTISDIYQDELFNPHSTIPTSNPPPRRAPNHNLLSPYRNVFSERIHDANTGHLNARSQSPGTSFPRERSPFRQGSPFAPQLNGHPQSRAQAGLGSAAQLRELQKAETDAHALRPQEPERDDLSTKTISPKDALLDYHESEEDSKIPLFRSGEVGDYSSSRQAETEFNPGEIRNDFEDDGTDQSFASMATSRRPSSSSYSTTPGPLQSSVNFPFVPPSIPGTIQLPQQYPFIPSQRQQETSVPMNGNHYDVSPEFPAHLTSMESSLSEPSIEGTSDLVKPVGAMADSGTYTCTYHGCTLRFETPAKLQKHKREGHRQSTPQTGGATMTSAALMRNSQAGPHKCERINPSTGKPCNTIFSRPYDLTRHEDTIHNSRKQKVRCRYCTEEKTFSRNDALTRHMRVVHPDIEFMGKARRRHQE